MIDEEGMNEFLPGDAVRCSFAYSLGVFLSGDPEKYNIAHKFKFERGIIVASMRAGTVWCSDRNTRLRYLLLDPTSNALGWAVSTWIRRDER